jgi:signal transduction histidine kinase/ligand-binding sensor domain-containing protein
MNRAVRRLRSQSLVAALCLPGLLGAQGARRLLEPQEFVLDQWTTSDGLPQNSVNAIAQTPDGHLWLGTFGGLVRFDGSSFRLQERTDSGGRHVDRILSLDVAPDSALWIGTEAGVLRFKDGRFEEVELPEEFPDAVVRGLRMDAEGGIWVGTQGGGLARLAGRMTRTWREANGVPVGSIGSILSDAQGTIWVNSGDRFLSFDARGPTRAHLDIPRLGTVVHPLLRDRSGALWLSFSDGVARVAEGGVRTLTERDGVREPAVMVEDPQGGYWFGTLNDGLYHINPTATAANARRYALPNGSTAYRVVTAFVARDGSTWFGTSADGLLRAKRQLFASYAEVDGLSHNVVTAVLEDAAGILWVATNCGGLNEIDRRRGTVRLHKPRMPNDPRGDPCVFSLAESPAGTMWIGTYGGGVTRLRGGVEERLRHSAGLRDSVVLALFADRAGAVWVGMHSGGLAALVDGRVARAYTTADGLAHNSVRTIYQARDGALWVGTVGGLSRLHEGAIRNFGAADGLASEHVRAIHEDAAGELWVGTYGGGLHRLRGERFVAVSLRQGLADDVVSSILEDANGYLWMSGNRGIQRVARSQLLEVTEGRSERVHAVLYGESDGLLNAETNGGFQPAAWRDARGTFWFPTVHGVARVDPARVTAGAFTPRAAVEEVLIDGVAVAPEEVGVLGPRRSNLEFRYAGLSLFDAEHLVYRYRLENFDDDWVAAGTRRAAYYPRLEPGRYRFLVAAAGRDGQWGDPAEIASLLVVGPIHQRWWFRVMALLFLIALSYVILSRRELTARRQRAAQEDFSRQLIDSQERERKRIAGELHDGLGQELLIVRNRALLAMRGAGLQDAAREQLQELTDVVSQSLENLRGLAHNLTPYQLDHLGLTSALQSMVEGIAEASGLPLDAVVDDVDGLFTREGQINLYRIVQEGLNNVVRHAHARSATVRVARMDQAVIVSIVDDGRGFTVRRDDDGRVVAGFGLSGMAERVRILGGRVDLASSGAGTRLRVEVPVK